MRRRRLTSWDEADEDFLIEVLKPHRPEVARFEEQRKRWARPRPALKRLLVRMCQQLGLDPGDPFLPAPEPGNLGEGIPIGVVESLEMPFHYGVDELPTSMAFLGSPKSGKTTAVIHVIVEVQRLAIGCLAADLRGDYLKAASRIHSAVILPGSLLRVSFFDPPPGVSAREWASVLAARITLDLGLQQAGLFYANRLMAELLEKAQAARVVPTLLDFVELVRRQSPKPRSSEEGYRERLLGRLEALLLLAGEEMFAVQRGHPISDLLEQGRLVCLDLRGMDKTVADLLFSLLVYRSYFERMYRADAFSSQTILFVLDEQRNLIRAQSHEVGIPDFELLASRARALNLGFLIAEQIPSAVSSAVLTACRLRLAFLTAPPEDFVVARLLGLNQEQMAELSRLAPGHCIARLAGDRCPGPFRLSVPFPEILR